MSELYNYVTSTINKDSIYTIEARARDSSDGLGNAHEALFGVVENNIAGPDVDIHNLELKASLIDCTTRVTLFTNAPKTNFLSEKKSATRALVERFGQADDDNPLRSNLYFTASVGRASSLKEHSFRITKRDEQYILTADNIPVVGWNQAAITKSAMRKLGGTNNPQNGSGALLLSKGTSTNTGGNNHQCVFSKSTLYEGFSIGAFYDLFNEGKIVVDFRAHSLDVGKPSLKIRDHGTAFRISEKYIGELYTTNHIIM
jgi:hypothetical protein